MTAKCIFNRFKFRPGDWVQIPTLKNPKKTELFKVLEANHFHHPNEPGSFTCGCNYKLASRANLISGKGDPFFLSTHLEKVIRWSVTLDSRRLEDRDVKALKSDRASKLNQKLESKSR